MNRYSDVAGIKEACQVTLINEEKVEEVKRNLIDDETASHLAETFRGLGDSTRIKIIYALLQSELCVCDLSAAVGISQSAASHQLRSLRNLKLVKPRREGQVVYYSLDDHHIENLLSQGIEHLKEG